MANKNIIIVEDTQEVGRLLKATLNTLDKDLVVSVVPNVEEALKEAETGGADLLITDHRLGNMTGRELAGRVMKTQPHLKVILIASKADSAVLRQAGLKANEAVLSKPMEIDAFLSTAKRFLNIGTGALPEEDLPTTGTDLLPALREMKSNLNALAVCLADKQGTILALAGEFPEKNFEGKWIPVILSMLATDVKMINLFSTPIGDGVHAFMGASFQLVFMTLDENALIAVLKPEQGHNHLLMSLGVVIDAQRDLIKAISGKTIRATAANASPPSTPPFDEFDTKLQQTEVKIKGEELERFWETGNEDGTVSIEGLTFDDAEKMGLMNKDEKSKKK